jgi:hypothetical protein
LHLRVCRECGEEYRPEILVCADCGGKLEDRYEDDSGLESPLEPPPPPKERPAPDLSGHRALFVSGHAAALLPFAERLRAAAIPLHIQASRTREGPGSRFTLYVPAGDGERALREVAPLVSAGVDPDLLQFDPELLKTVDRDFDPDSGYRRCPACGADLGGAPKECPECGLVVAGGPEG